MEEKYSTRHCIGRMKHNCKGCSRHFKCVLVSIGLIAKRFVLFAKRCVLRMFTRSPRKERTAEPMTPQRFMVYAVGCCMLISCFVAFFIPIFGMEKVSASDQPKAPSYEEPATEVARSFAFTDEAYALEESENLAPEASEPNQTEVTTDVVEQAGGDTNSVTIVDLSEPVEPIVEKESLEDVMAEYDIPLDYDVDLAFMGMDYLINEQGFSVAGAAGVMGNFYAECRFDSSEIDGSHKGLAQWDSTYRWPMVAEWLSDNGYELTSFMGQMQAIFYSNDANEFTSGHPYNTFAKMREATDPRNAALTWLYEYERAPGQAEQTRQNMAELTYELYSRTK